MKEIKEPCFKTAYWQVWYTARNKPEIFIKAKQNPKSPARFDNSGLQNQK